MAKQLLKPCGEFAAELELGPCSLTLIQSPVCPSDPGLPFSPVLCPRETLCIYTSNANTNPEPAGWEDLAGHQMVGEREGKGSCLPSSVLSWDGLCPSELQFLLYLQL